MNRLNPLKNSLFTGLKLFLIVSVLGLTLIIASFDFIDEKPNKRPNILFCIADDWGWPHAGTYGDRVVQTPVFDRLANEGVLFENAFVSSPSCTPSRGAILTGQHFWRLGEGANLWSTLDKQLPVYPLLLEKHGYFVGSWRKSWGPGDLRAGGYTDSHPAGKKYNNGFEAFLKEKPDEAPFCFWLGASDPHRAYEEGTGEASGIELSEIAVPEFYPETDVIKSDLADYYFEVGRFDSDVGKAIALLDSIGELENTIIVVTGDHGMPFPRCKGNLYDMGTRVPLVVYWGSHIQQNHRVSALVSLTDLAPTFLEAAGVAVPDDMTGKSLLPFMMNKTIGLPDADDFALFGRERHTPAQSKPSMAGYPSRAIRTGDYLYIRNFFPDRWPAGVPEGSTHPMNSFSDSDNGPTKAFLIENKESLKQYYEWSFGKRPQEEFYKLANDPFQLRNLADDKEYKAIKDSLSTRLFKALSATGDPRVTESLNFDEMPYRAGYKLN